MDQLIGRVDSGEARRHGSFYQLGSGVFFPGRAIHERRNGNVVIGGQGHLASNVRQNFTTSRASVISIALLPDSSTGFNFNFLLLPFTFGRPPDLFAIHSL